MHINQDLVLFKKCLSTLAAIALTIPPVTASAREHAGQPRLSMVTQNPAPPMMAMPLIAPLFLEDNEFTSTLVLVNASSENTYATITVRSLSGSIITRQKVPLPPSNQVRIPVSGLLLQTWSTDTRGSILVEQSPDLMGMAVLAQLSITHRGSRLSYIDEELAMPDATMGSRILRAVGHGKDASTLVAISSLAQIRLAIRIDCLSRNAEPVSKTIEVAPSATVVTEACSNGGSSEGTLTSEGEGENLDESEAFGMELTSNGGAGEFAAFGISRSRSNVDKVLAGVAFSDPKLTVSSATVFVGLPMGAADLLGPGSYKPYVTVANFTLRPARIKVSFSNTLGAFGPAGTSNVVVRAVTVPPQRATVVSLSGLQGDPGLRNSFVITSDGAPGDIAVGMASKASGGQGEVQLLAKDAQQQENAGFHPWSSAEGNDSTLLTFNHTAHQQRIVVTILSGKVLWLKSIALSPFETNSLSVTQLIKEKIPDDHQQTLPPDLNEGEVSWSMETPKTITGRLLVSNRITAVARNFSCGAYPVLCGASMGPSSGIIPVGGSGNAFILNAVICIAYHPFDCYGSGSGGGITPQYSWYGGGGAFSIPTSCSGAGVCSPTGNSPGTAPINGIASYLGCSFGGAAQVTVQQATVSLSPSTVAPSGRSTVTVTLTPALAGQRVSLTATGVANSGGHQHTASRPIGKFSLATGSTDSSGKFTTTYTASAFGGSETVNATVNFSTGSQALTVAVSGLGVLGSGSHYTLTGPTSSHPSDHYGTATANANLVTIANQYAATFPGGVLSYNDQSLPQGGQFDINADWNTPHVEHRLGINCDVSETAVPVANRPTLLTIFVNNGSPNYLDETNHWHLRFGAVGNPAGD